MKNLKLNFYIWVYNFVSKRIKTKYTNEQKTIINRIKYCFRNFFQGGYDYDDQIYETYIPIKNFGITDLDFKFDSNMVTLTITMEFPGIIIGKGGRTIDALREYLNDVLDNYSIKIDLKESKLWHRI